ncbi:MAG: TetR/AcrR family transcriptional regulator [Acidimicrobiales bacterium]|jgi:AcrR family transcriptional regulator
MNPPVTRPFRGVSAPDRLANRRQRLVEAAFDLAGRRGAASLGVGDVCAAAGLTKRYFYESFESIDQLGAAVVDRAIEVMVELTEPFRPGTAGGSVYGGIKAFIDALLDDRRLARILITETQAGSLSRFRGRIVEVAVASLLPIDQLADTQSLDQRRFIAYAQIGALGEICLAWHQGVVEMGRDELVDQLVDLFARIAAPPRT